MDSEHELVIIYGPVKEGEPAIIGKGVNPMDGWGWSCSCGQAGFGYADEPECELFADLHEFHGTPEGAQRSQEALGALPTPNPPSRAQKALQRLKDWLGLV